jgi:hypothetical protein
VSVIEDWRTILENLGRDDGLKPCYWIGAPSNKENVETWFPGIVYHVNFDAIRGIPPAAYSNMPLRPLDQHILQEMAFEETIVFQMMNRMGWDEAFTYNERVQLYHKLLRYWLTILDLIKPVLFIRYVVPHILYDYVLFQLCKKKGIPTITFRQTSVPGVFFPTTGYNQEHDTIVSAYKKQHIINTTPEAPLSQAIEEQVQTVSGHQYKKAMPYYMQKQREREEKRQQRGAVVHFLIQLIPPYLRTPYRIYKIFRFSHYPLYFATTIQFYLRFVNVPPSYLIKFKGRKVEDTNISPWEYHWSRMRASRYKKSLKLRYEQLAQQAVDLNQPYVYVPLHFQPERTTSPEAEVFANQFLMIDILSYTLPKGWKIYVKEHPSQFILELGYLGRTPDFYDRLLQYPHVQLVPLSATPFELIDKSQAIATGTGTVGWEAILRGKPVMCFGHPWYKGCEGVFYTPSVESAAQFFTMLQQGYQVRREGVEEFIQAMEHVCTYIYLDGATKEQVGEAITEEQNIERITNAIQVLYRSAATNPGSESGES